MFGCVTSRSCLLAIWFTIERQFVAFAICSLRAAIRYSVAAYECDIRLWCCSVTVSFLLYVIVLLRALFADMRIVMSSALPSVRFSFFYLYILAFARRVIRVWCCICCAFKSLLRLFNWLPESVCRFAPKKKIKPNNTPSIFSYDIMEI